jgi:hypothetical protein
MVAVAPAARRAYISFVPKDIFDMPEKPSTTGHVERDVSYEVHFTQLAAAFAKAKSSLETVEAQARHEMQQLIDIGLSNPRKLICHVFEAGAQKFIAAGRPYGIEIDTCSYEDGWELDDGPLKGKQVMIPRGDSES